jgi:hypothetical protein
MRLLVSWFFLADRVVLLQQRCVVKMMRLTLSSEHGGNRTAPGLAMLPG